MFDPPVIVSIIEKVWSMERLNVEVNSKVPMKWWNSDGDIGVLPLRFSDSLLYSNTHSIAGDVSSLKTLSSVGSNMFTVNLSVNL